MTSIDWNKFWDEKASTYETQNERNTIAASMVGEGKKVLDIGCGRGDLMEMLQKDNIVLGMDFSAKMLIHCYKKGLKVLWGEATDIPFEYNPYVDNRFDAVTALGLIEYLPEDSKFIKEVYRVLKPGGTAIVSFRNELFSKWSGRDFEQERRSHNPDTVEFPGFKIEEIVFFHEHQPHKFEEEKYYHSGFIVKMVKEKTK